jgi:YegS/Rv2252/BmrU family lipid kinase
VTKRKFLVIVNPVAGKGKYHEQLDRIKSEFNTRSIAYDLHFTSEEKKADLLTKATLKNEKFTDLLILGGDGTINEAINGLGIDSIPVSVISFGTGNDTLKHIHPRLDFDYQLHTAFEGSIRKIDAGECNGRLFLNGVGIGFDGKVVERMAAKGKKFTGYISYLTEVLRILLTYKEKNIMVDFNQHKINMKMLLMTVAKGTTFGGGFKINPYAENDDGLLDICMMGEIPQWVRISYVMKMKSGGHRGLKPVSFYKSNEVYVHENPSVVAHMDGEFIGHPPFRIIVHPKAIRFRI